MHFQKMFTYGNTLGNAWILKTHYMRMLKEMRQEFKSFTPGKTSFKDRFKKNAESANPIGVWVTEKEKSCYKKEKNFLFLFLIAGFLILRYICVSRNVAADKE